MTYKELQSFLEEREFDFHCQVNRGSGGEVVTGLFAYCSPIIHSKRIERLKEVLPEGFNCFYQPSSQEIHITKTN